MTVVCVIRRLCRRRIAGPKPLATGLLLLLLLLMVLPPATSGTADVAAPPDAASNPIRPYSPDSPWNLKIGPHPVYDPHTTDILRGLKGYFVCDLHRDAVRVYRIDEDSPMRQMWVESVCTRVRGDGILLKEAGATFEIPMPEALQAVIEAEVPIVCWNSETGDEWGLRGFAREIDQLRAGFAYRYNTNLNGVPPPGFSSRGAGVPWLAGLVRPWEIRRGRIEHAIALGVKDPSRVHVYPATRSTGTGELNRIPLGTRLQLDPALTEADFDCWELDRSARIIARAMQEYGMIAVDGSDCPKIFVEHDATAHWDGFLHRDTLRAIPYSAFRVLSLSYADRPPVPAGFRAEVVSGRVQLSWQLNPWTSRYWVIRHRLSPGGGPAWQVSEVVEPAMVDSAVGPGTEWQYWVVAVNHNGVSEWSEPVTVEIAH